MRHLLFPGLMLLSLFGNAATVRYEISPLFSDNSAPRLQVRIFLQGEPDGTTAFTLPDQFGPAGGLFNCIQNLSCPSRACTLMVNREKYQALIKHPASAELELYYELTQDFEGSDFTLDNAFRPLIQPGYFHVLGSALFVTPDFGESSCEVTLDWRNFPENWLIHNSFGTQQRLQRIPFSKSKLIESVFVGGDFRVLKTEVENRPVYLALRGYDWGFGDDELMVMLQKTVATQRDFWQDWDIPYYTVTLLPLAHPPAMAGGQNYLSLEYLGTGLHNSFAAFVTPSPRLGVAELHHLFNHEMMHNWIGNKIRSGGGPDDMHFGWFSEGFTEYFTLKNLLDGGFISVDGYMEALNTDFFEPHYTSPIGELPNSAIASDFFTDEAVAQLAYKRGFVFAFFLDNAIKSNSGDQSALHDFMLDLLEYYTSRNKDLVSNFDFFEEKLTEYLKQESAPLLQKYIQEGERIPPEAFVLPEYFIMETNENGTPVVRLNKLAQGWEKEIRN